MADIFVPAILIMAATAMPFNATTGSWNDTTEEISVSGCAAYYNSRLMEDTAVYRGYIKDASEYEDWLKRNGYKGAVALYRNGDKDREVHILWPDGTLDGPYLAIDVVARHHYDLGMSKNRVIDVDWNTAVRMDMKGPMSVILIYGNEWIADYLYNDDGEFKIEGYSINAYEDCLSNS